MTWNDAKWHMHNFYMPVKNAEVSGTKGAYYRIYGLTARMLVDAATVAYEEATSFVMTRPFGEEEMIRRLLRRGKMGADKAKKDGVLLQDLAKAGKL